MYFEDKSDGDWCYFFWNTGIILTLVHKIFGPGRMGDSAMVLEVTYQLEQLERLCSEIPPTAPWLPILVIHIRSQVKTR